MKLAIFDLDLTLLPVDSDHTWGEFCIAEKLVDPLEHRARNDFFAKEYAAGTLDLHAYVAFAMRAIAGKPLAEAVTLHARYMREWIMPHITPQALALVERHRAAGETCIIVTATNEFITRDIARAFAVEHLIAVNIRRDAQGRLTNTIDGLPSFQAGKITRLQMWLAARGLSWSDVSQSTFYSDSMNDVPLLEWVTHPVATNPEARLRTLATQRGWPILDLFA